MYKNHFTLFKTNIKKIELPKKFTFPFYYEPHKLCKIAVSELQEKLVIQSNWQHNFGLDINTSKNGIGKMFGVLIVKDNQNKIGYLTAFSGKLEGKNNAVNFVPPVFDIFSKNGFFQKEEKLITKISQEIIKQENNPILIEKNEVYKKLEQEKNKVLFDEKEKLKLRRKKRREKREEIIAKSEEGKVKDKEIKDLRLKDTRLCDFAPLRENKLIKQSLHDKFYFRELSIYWEEKLQKIKNEIDILNNSILNLKTERKERSEKIHQQIFDQYQFLNATKNSKSLNKIFQEINKKPIAGTGNCVAPKLLQFAFENDLKPIAMAEFWWGKPLKNEIRKHKNYYPACNGKCKPILNYMLQGVEMDGNPILINLAKDKKIETIYEDEYLIVINKPAELLSVSGKNIQDSVHFRMQEKYPNLNTPFIVHRLDMSTSGLLLIAKTKQVHKKLQSQFINRTIKKEYVAILDGIISVKKGTIKLPLTTDFNDTPRQKVCFEKGKKATTNYEIIEIKNGKTRIKFQPITGRTHQLRVHAAHYLGLNTSIVGDDLYGKKRDRLCLHACSLEFVHPINKEIMVVECNVPF